MMSGKRNIISFQKRYVMLVTLGAQHEVGWKKKFARAGHLIIFSNARSLPGGILAAGIELHIINTLLIGNNIIKYVSFE